MVVRGKKARTLLAAAAILVPQALRRVIHQRLLGYDIHRTAQIGRSLVDVDRLTMSEGASIGSFTVIRGCEDVILRVEAAIGPLVWVNSVRKGKGYFAGQDHHGALIMGRGAAITCLHFLDCCDTIEFGEYSILGGYASQVLTHTVSIATSKQTTKPVSIGHHTMVGTSSVILPGVTIPPCSLVGAGSVVTKNFADTAHLYAGVPAMAWRPLNPQSPFFNRTCSKIW